MQENTHSLSKHAKSRMITSVFALGEKRTSKVHISDKFQGISTSQAILYQELDSTSRLRHVQLMLGVTVSKINELIYFCQVNI